MAKTQPACAEVRGKDERRQTKPLPRANAQRQKPASGKPLHIDCVSGTPENWRVRRGSANARLGHAYPWYATYSSHIPASLRTFPQRKPPRRRPTEAAAAEAFLESPELMEADAHAAGGKDAVDGGGMEPPELVFELDEPTFAPTYRTWTVEYTDGTSKVFEA